MQPDAVLDANHRSANGGRGCREQRPREAPGPGLTVLKALVRSSSAIRSASMVRACASSSCSVSSRTACRRSLTSDPPAPRSSSSALCSHLASFSSRRMPNVVGDSVVSSDARPLRLSSCTSRMRTSASDNVDKCLPIIHIPHPHPLSAAPHAALPPPPPRRRSPPSRISFRRRR